MALDGAVNLSHRNMRRRAGAGTYVRIIVPIIPGFRCPAALFGIEFHILRRIRCRRLQFRDCVR
jgi:hypothetical protein